MEMRGSVMGKAVWAACLLAMFLLCGMGAAASEAETKLVETELAEVILPDEKEVYQLLLIGSDRRDDSWNGNSDVMILVTVQANNRRIIMTSFMRDLNAEIPGHGTAKLNHAFAVGGAELLQETLEDNYDLDIDNYMIVDFDSMADVVDRIGGVQIEVTDEECVILNQYLEVMGAAESSLPCGGDYLLNGYQAVAYMRIRHVGNNDYQRTQRQRDVLSQMFSQAQTLGAQDLLGLAADLIEQVEHDIDPFDLLQLTASVPGMATFELEENRVPYDDMYTSKRGRLIPTQPDTTEKLHELIDG